MTVLICTTLGVAIYSFGLIMWGRAMDARLAEIAAHHDAEMRRLAAKYRPIVIRT